jgi:hypothetical protein
MTSGSISGVSPARLAKVGHLGGSGKGLLKAGPQWGLMLWKGLLPWKRTDGPSV